MIKHYVLTLFLEIILPGQSAISKIGNKKATDITRLPRCYSCETIPFFKKFVNIA
jgi:hypothetical protein